MEGNRYGGVSQKQKGLRLRHDVNPDNLRKLKDSYEIATMKGKEMRNSASTNLYVKVHGQRAGQVYAALASLLHATISLTRADGLEEFIRQTAATLPANMIDLEEWGPVLDAARESREAAAWSLLPSQPSLDEMVRKNKVFNFFFYHHPMHHFRDELKVMKSEIWRTLAGFQKDLQQCLLLLQATVAQLLRSKDIEVQQERLAVLKREIRSLETSLADTQSLLESSQDELGSAKDTIEQLEREKEDLSHTLQETKSELSAQTASREDTEKKLQGTENALQAAQVELQALRSSQETVIAGLRDELQLLQQESVLRQEAEAEIEKLKRDFAQEAIHYLAHQTSVDAAQAGLIEIAQRRMSEAEQIAEETKEDLRVALQANTDMHASLMACQSLLQNTQQISQERFDLVLKLREEVQQAHRGWTEMRTELDDLSAFSMTRLTELSLALNEAMREKQQINEGQNALLNEQKELLQQLEQEQVTLLSRQRELEQEQTVLLDQQKEICQQLEQERAVQKQLLEELQEVQREKVMCEKALQDCQLLLAEAQEVAARSRRKSVGVLTVPPLQEDEVNEASDLHVEEEKEEQNSEQVVEIVQLESDRAGNEEQKEQVVEEEVAPNLLLARDVAMKSISSGLATMPLKIVPSLETLAKRSTTASAVRDDVAQHNRSSSPRQEQQVQNAEEHQTVNEEQKEGEVEKAAVQMQSLARGFLGRQKTKRLLGEESKGEEEDKEEEGGGEREEDVVSDVLAKIVSSISSVEERVEGGEEKEQENEASPGGGADGVEVEAKTEVENAENVTEAVAMVTEEAVVTSGGQSGNGDDVDHPREGSGEEAVASSAEEVVSEVVSAMVGRIESEGEAAREGNVAANMQNEGVGEAGQKEGEVEKAAVQMQSLARGFLGRQKTKRLLGEESKGEEEDKEEEGGGEREEDVVSDVLAKIVSSISSVEERVEGGEEKEQENEASPGGGADGVEVEAKAEKSTESQSPNADAVVHDNIGEGESKLEASVTIAVPNESVPLSDEDKVAEVMRAIVSKVEGNETSLPTERPPEQLEHQEVEGKADQTVNEEQTEGEVEKAAVQMQSLARGFLGRQKTKRLLGEESKGEEEDKEEEGGGEREEDVVSDVLAKIVSSISSVEERVEGGEEKEQENEASPGGGADGVEVEAKTEVENAENVTEAVAMVTEEAVVTSGGESGNGDDVDHPREGSGEEAVASSAEEVVSEVVSAMVGRIESEGEAAREGNVAANMQNEGVGEAGQKEGEVEKAAVQMQSLARGFLGRQKTKRLLGEESKGEEEDKEEEGGGEREEDVVSDVLAKIVSSISSVEERVEGGEEKEQENEASPGGGGAEEVEAKAEVEVAQGKEGEKKSVSDEQAVRVQSLARGFLGRQKVRRLLTENLAVQQGILLAHGDTKQGSTGWYSTDGQLFYFCLDDKDFLLLCGPLSTLMHDQACANYRTAMGAEADKKRPVVIDRLAIQATRLQIDTLLSDLVERDAYISTLEAKVNDLQTQLSSQRLAVEEYSQALLGLDAIRNELALYKEKYKGDALHGFLEKAQLVKESHRGGLIRLTSIIRGFLARKRVKRLKLTRLADDTGVLVAMENTLQGETGWYLGPNGSIYYFVLKDGQWIYAAGPLSEQDFKATYLQGAKSFGRSVPSGKILTRCAFRLGTVVAPNSEVYIANGSAKLFLAVPVDVIIPELLVNGSSSQLPEASLFSAQGSSLSQMDSLLEESSSLILEGNSIPSAK